MVDKITLPNTSNSVSRTPNTGDQSRARINNQDNTNSPLTSSRSPNNAPLNTANTLLDVPTKTTVNGNSKLFADVQSVISAIQQLPVKQKITAQVTSSQALNSDELALLARSNPKLMQQLKAAQATQTQNTATTKLNATLQPNSSTLHLTKLAIDASAHTNLSIASKIITTITLQPFSLDQTLILGQQNGQLQINANSQPSFNLQTRLQQAASQIIKNVLPKQESVSQLQQFTGQLSQTISKLPPSLQLKLASRPVIQALNELNRFTQTNTSLREGAQVQQALTNSGISFEAKLMRSNSLAHHLNAGLTANSLKINDNYAATNSHLRNNLSINSQANLSNDIRIILDKILSAIHLPDTNPRLTGSFTALNQADIDKLIAAVAATLNNSNATVTNPINTPKNLTATTAALCRLLGIAIPFDAPVATQLPRAVEQHLKKLVEQTHAKIQFNQLRSIGLDQPFNETKANLQQFHTELPLRFNEQILALQLSIYEQEPAHRGHREGANQEAEDETQSTPTRRWQVLLSFDLPNDEKLHTQLIIIESSISATLWTQSQSLCDRAQKDISWLRDKLLANGLAVTDISCLRGSPPQKGTSLSYNLVDIKT